MTWRFTREEPELLTDIRDLRRKSFQMVRVVYPEWLKYAIRDFAFFIKCFFWKNRLLNAYFRDSGKRSFYIRDPLFFPFVNRARDPPVRPSSHATEIFRARHQQDYFECSAEITFLRRHKAYSISQFSS